VLLTTCDDFVSNQIAFLFLKGVNCALRISLYYYNTNDEIDWLAEVMGHILRAGHRPGGQNVPGNTTFPKMGWFTR